MTRIRLLVAVALLVATAPFPGGPASASCAGPSIDVERGTALAPGGALRVEGRHFVDGCQDTGTCPAFGCGACEYDDPPPEPMEDLSLRLVQGDRSWVLGTADAGTAADGEQGQVIWSVELPEDVRPGPARLLAEGAMGARVRIVRP
jgi:hypothetical protein